VNLFRCYIPGTRDHFLAVSRTCGGIVVEAWLGAIATRELSGTTPLYRLYNRSNGDHFYTISSSERQSALNTGWVSEGVSGYGYRQW
jgi:hypothetical protein